MLVGAIGTVSTLIVTNLAAAEQPAEGEPEAPAEPAAEPIEFPDDTPAAVAGAEPCIQLSVMSSFENAEMGHRCATVGHMINISHREGGMVKWDGKKVTT